MGYVYVLSNEAMPGLVKIGFTESDIVSRISQLYTTGVPLPFEVEFAALVENAKGVEGALHSAFGPYRINQKREYFRILPSQAVAILKLLHKGEDTTQQVADEVDKSLEPAERTATKEARKRRPNYNFAELGIPIDSILTSTSTEETAIVVGPTTVRYQENEMSLSEATRRDRKITYPLAPTPFWIFNGSILKDLYEEAHGEE